MSGTLSFEYQVILICLLFLCLFELLSAPKRSFAIVYLKTNHESWNTGNWELTVSLQLNIFRKKICTRYLCTFLLIWRLVFTWVLLGTKLKDSTILALVLLYYHKTRRFWKPKKDSWLGSHKAIVSLLSVIWNCLFVIPFTRKCSLKGF